MISHHLEFASAWLLFIALFALYSPLAALSSYIPYVEGYSNAEQRKLAFALFLNVLIMSMVALWVGEPVLALLGISVPALAAVGGIALLLEAVPMMMGTAHHPSASGLEGSKRPPWRSIAFTPITFPLTFGGTTFSFFVAYRAESNSWTGAIGLSIAALAYAAITGITLYAAGHVGRRVKPTTANLLEKIAGILLVAISVILLASGGTRLVVDVLHSL